jgi:hypothetical protein
MDNKNDLSTLSTGTYVGIIQDYFDESYPANFFVKIPELTDYTEIIMVENKLNDYSAVRKGELKIYSGSYSPLIPGTKVYIKFYTSEITSGYIDSIHYDSQAVPPGQDIDGYYLLKETPNGTRIYIDDTKKRLHLSNANKTDIFMDDESVILQTNTADNKVASFMELSKNGFIIKFKDRSLIFNEAGFSINAGTNANTFFNMTDKGISMKGEEFLSIDTDKLDIRGQSTNIQSLGQLHIRGTILNLTGTQKAALNSSVVHIEGWMSTYIKAGLSLNLESKVFLRTQTLINDETNLALKHTYSSIESSESTMSAETSTFKANAISTIANDGTIINNLGVAAGTAPSLATSLTATSTGLHMGFLGFGTFLSFDNIASSVVGTVLTDTMIADAASVASPNDKSLMGVFIDKEDVFSNDESFINKLIALEDTRKNQYSDTIVDYEQLNGPSFSTINTSNTGIYPSTELEIISSTFLKG